MTVADLVFKYDVDSEIVYDPVEITTSVVIKVTNLGVEDLTDLGLYIAPASGVGDVDEPASYAPETDYEDLLTWGTDGIGGIEVTVDTVTTQITRSVGSSWATRIPFPDLDSGATETFTITFTDPGLSARRFYVDLLLE